MHCRRQQACRPAEGVQDHEGVKSGNVNVEEEGPVKIDVSTFPGRGAAMVEITTRTQPCCYLSTPEHVRSFVGTFFYIYTDKGDLALTEDCLRFTGKHQIPIEIALKTITDINVG